MLHAYLPTSMAQRCVYSVIAPTPYLLTSSKAMRYICSITPSAPWPICSSMQPDNVTSCMADTNKRLQQHQERPATSLLHSLRNPLTPQSSHTALYGDESASQDDNLMLSQARKVVIVCGALIPAPSTSCQMEFPNPNGNASPESSCFLTAVGDPE